MFSLKIKLGILLFLLSSAAGIYYYIDYQNNMIASLKQSIQKQEQSINQLSSDLVTLTNLNKEQSLRYETTLAGLSQHIDNIAKLKQKQANFKIELGSSILNTPDEVASKINAAIKCAQQPSDCISERR